MQNLNSLFQNFSKLNRAERFARLLQAGLLTQEDIDFLQNSVTSSLTHLADHLVENAIGCFPLPLGIATNFCIDGNDYAIPMAVEETSIIAAASKTAKWIRMQGSIHTAMDGQCIIGQIQIPAVQNIEKLKKILDEHKNRLIDELNQGIAYRLFQRGGGVKNLILREIPQHHPQPMAVIHVLLNPCDAMGANIISQICEALKSPIESLTQEKVGLCILSNLVDTKLTKAHVVIHNIDLELGEKIAQASQFASQDPYRAATHNKGILNGIDAVLIATGNDWRAVEAGIHAYAAKQGQYQPVATWSMHGSDLHGFFEAPVIVGTVGGVTRVHPTAQLCLKLLGVESSEMLSRIVAAVGLVQNLGALRALSQEGICQGHMKLHLDNLLLAAGATHPQISDARKKLQTILQREKKVSLRDAEQVLECI